jgi:hypothetical protein
VSRLCILAQYMSVWSHAPAIAGLYTCGINLIGAKAVLVDQARIDKGWAPLPTLTLAGTAALGGWFGGFYEIAKGHSHVAHDADARQLYFAGCCVNIAGSTLLALQHPVFKPVLRLLLRR